MKVATKSKPIIFTGESVKAILAGTKTQTRRVITHEWLRCPCLPDDIDEVIAQCPHPVGSVLWVKERYSPCACEVCKAAWPNAGPHKPIYEVDHAGPSGVLFRNPMFMPRWASRLSIEITAVKVERVQDISIADCHAEGVEPMWDAGRMEDDIFAERWDAINGKKHPWSSDPWVWCYTFRIA